MYVRSLHYVAWSPGISHFNDQVYRAGGGSTNLRHKMHLRVETKRKREHRKSERASEREREKEKKYANIGATPTRCDNALYNMRVRVCMRVSTCVRKCTKKYGAYLWPRVTSPRDDGHTLFYDADTFLKRARRPGNGTTNGTGRMLLYECLPSRTAGRS